MHVEIQEDEWKLAMRRGDFEAAWQVTDLLEARRRSAPPMTDNLLWNGDDPRSRSVSVRCLPAWEILADLENVQFFLAFSRDPSSKRRRARLWQFIDWDGGRAGSSIWRALWCRWMSFLA